MMQIICNLTIGLKQWFYLSILLIGCLNISCDYRCELTSQPFLEISFVDKNGTPVVPNQLTYQRKGGPIEVRFRESLKENILLLSSSDKINPILFFDRDNEGEYTVVVSLKGHSVIRVLLIQKGQCHAKTQQIQITFPFIYCDEDFKKLYSRSYDFSKSCL